MTKLEQALTPDPNKLMRVKLIRVPAEMAWEEADEEWVAAHPEAVEKIIEFSPGGQRILRPNAPLTRQE